MNRLMLCAGVMRREGWKTLDCDRSQNPDFLGWIPPLPAAVTREQWHEIEWIHGITSFYPWDAKQILSEIKPILAPGGKLMLEQPDLAYVVSLLPPKLEWIFGDPQFQKPEH